MCCLDCCVIVGFALLFCGAVVCLIDCFVSRYVGLFRFVVCGLACFVAIVLCWCVLFGLVLFCWLFVGVLVCLVCFCLVCVVLLCLSLV